MEQAESRHYYMQKILSMNYAHLETPNVQTVTEKNLGVIASQWSWETTFIEKVLNALSTTL